MEPILNIAEIGTLRERARRKTSAVLAPGKAPAATAFDPRQVGQPSSAQLQGLERVHRNCAENIAGTLGILLRTGVEVEFASVEQICFADFLEKLPDAAYLTFWGKAFGATALLQIDLSLVFPILDRVLGGTGQEATEARDLTEIEQEIFEPVSRGLVQALREAWEPVLKIDEAGAQRVAKTEAAERLAPTDQMLIVAFQMRLQETQGRLLVAFPSAISGALLRRFAPSEVSPQLSGPRESGRLREQLLGGRFETELRLPRSTVSIRQLCGLRPGDVVVLQVGSGELLPVHVAGREMFLALPVRCGTRRGAQVQKILSIIPTKEGEESK
jgi:flagellar motor switch protein FliM